jgi:hypothetical protein
MNFIEPPGKLGILLSVPTLKAPDFYLRSSCAAVCNILKKLSRTEQSREEVVAYLWLWPFNSPILQFFLSPVLSTLKILQSSQLSSSSVLSFSSPLNCSVLQFSLSPVLSTVPSPVLSVSSPLNFLFSGPPYSLVSSHFSVSSPLFSVSTVFSFSRSFSSLLHSYFPSSPVL